MKRKEKKEIDQGVKEKLHMPTNLEQTILRNLLLTDEDYMRKVLPFIKPDYFCWNISEYLFNEAGKFVAKV